MSYTDDAAKFVSGVFRYCNARGIDYRPTVSVFKTAYEKDDFPDDVRLELKKLAAMGELGVTEEMLMK
ncbi:MAG: hypothetical protein V1900_03765 [Candidatus Aenigmatarchaeota archaeon]